MGTRGRGLSPQFFQALALDPTMFCYTRGLGYPFVEDFYYWVYSVDPLLSLS